MHNEVVAVVVTYNRKDMLIECIKHLLKQQNAQCDILIIDNASTDGTKDALTDYISEQKILYVNTGENLGGAGGFQFGIREAYKLGYKYFWLMDDDTYVKEHALSELIEAGRKHKENYGFLSSVTYWKDGTLCKMNRQHIDLKHRVTSVPNDEQVISMATFVSFFIRREIVESVGLPIKEFFIWADDLEYTRRISLKYPCYLIPKSEVVHYMGSNEKVGIDSDAEDRLWRYSYLYRNEAYVYRREGIKGKLFYSARVMLHIVRVILKSGSNKKERLHVIIQSVKDGIKFNPSIEHVV